MPNVRKRISKSAIERAIIRANEIDGRGKVVQVVWFTPKDSDEVSLSGLAVRQHDHNMDGVEFRVLDHGKMIKYLEKLRVVI